MCPAAAGDGPLPDNARRQAGPAAGRGVVSVTRTEQPYDVAAYVWPAYSDDQRARIFFPERIGEWERVRQSQPKFPGHQQPRRPLWGYQNEADPRVMAMQIDAAADHGVNVFIYDWYWYDRRPFLEGCLNDGFLQAANHERMRFYLMWANHDATTGWDLRNSDDPSNVVWNGFVDRAEFEVIGRRVIERYLCHPAYYTLGGRPVFSIYDLANLVKGFGGVAETRQGLDWFRREAERAGLPGLHLQAVLWSRLMLNLSGVDGPPLDHQGEVVQQLGFDSATNYQWCHLANVNRPCLEVLADAVKWWKQAAAEYPIPFFPHVSIGWDSNARTVALRPNIMTANEPDKFAAGLREARAYLDARPELPRLVTINSWNEWTESSYLLPDTDHGMGYLEAVREVFGS